MAIHLPDWNGLANDERDQLVRVVSRFSWPPGMDGQFALEFYTELRRIMRDHEAKIPMTD